MADRWREILAPRMVEEIEREIEQAYRTGWSDCRRALLRALEEIGEQPLREQSRGTSGTKDPSDIGWRRRVPRGFWQDRIVEVLREHGTPLTPTELLKAIAEKTSFPVSRTSLHSALQTLRKRGKVDRRDGRWKLIEQQQTGQGWLPVSDLSDE